MCVIVCITNKKGELNMNNNDFKVRDEKTPKPKFDLLDYLPIFCVLIMTAGCIVFWLKAFRVI